METPEPATDEFGQLRDEIAHFIQVIGVDRRQQRIDDIFWGWTGIYMEAVRISAYTVCRMASPVIIAAETARFIDRCPSTIGTTIRASALCDRGRERRRFHALEQQDVV